MDSKYLLKQKLNRGFLPRRAHDSWDKKNIKSDINGDKIAILSQYSSAYNFINWDQLTEG